MATTNEISLSDYYISKKEIDETFIENEANRKKEGAKVIKNALKLKSNIDHTHDGYLSTNGGTITGELIVNDKIKANQYIIPDETGFIKADGTVDTNNYSTTEHTHTEIIQLQTDINTLKTHNHDNTYIKNEAGTVTTNHILNGTIQNEDIANNTIEYNKTKEYNGNGNNTTTANAHVKILKITINGAYQNIPISFDIYQRGTKEPSHVNLQFENSNGTDPGIESFVYTGGKQDIYIRHSGTSQWEIIVKKTEPNDKIHIRNLQTGQAYAGNTISFEGLNAIATLLPTNEKEKCKYIGLTEEDKEKIQNISAPPFSTTQINEESNLLSSLNLNSGATQQAINQQIDIAIASKSDNGHTHNYLTQNTADSLYQKQEAGKGLSEKNFTSTYENNLKDLTDSSKTIKNGHKHTESDITNLGNYITKDVNNLTNYTKTSDLNTSNITNGAGYISNTQIATDSYTISGNTLYSATGTVFFQKFWKMVICNIDVVLDPGAAHSAQFLFHIPNNYIPSNIYLTKDSNNKLTRGPNTPKIGFTDGNSSSVSSPRKGGVASLEYGRDNHNFWELYIIPRTDITTNSNTDVHVQLQISWFTD